MWMHANVPLSRVSEHIVVTLIGKQQKYDGVFMCY